MHRNHSTIDLSARACSLLHCDRVRERTCGYPNECRIRTIQCRFVCHDLESTGTELNARMLSEPLSHWITNVLVCGKQKATAGKAASLRCWGVIGRWTVCLPEPMRQQLGVGQEALVGASRRPTVRRQRQPRAHPPRRYGPTVVNLCITGSWHRKWLPLLCSKDEIYSWFIKKYILSASARTKWSASIIKGFFDWSSSDLFQQNGKI